VSLFISRNSFLLVETRIPVLR